MRNIELEKTAIKDYQELNNIVKNTNLSLEELCKELGGHNLNSELFDVNFKSICATVFLREKHLELSDVIEIWDDEKCEEYDLCFYVSRFKER